MDGMDHSDEVDVEHVMTTALGALLAQHGYTLPGTIRVDHQVVVVSRIEAINARGRREVLKAWHELRLTPKCCPEQQHHDRAS